MRREMNSLLVFKWNQHPCCHTFPWNQHFLVYALGEMNSLLVFKSNQHPCCHAFMQNLCFKLFMPKIAVFKLTHCVKCTVCLFLSEINILAVTPSCQINISTYLGLKSPFWGLCAASNEQFGCFYSEINILAVTPSREVTF